MGGTGMDPGDEAGRTLGRDRDSDLIRRALAQARGVRDSSDERVMPPLSLAPDQFPGYQVLREIHRGGQGVVYQAIQLTTRRKVAIKVMHQGPFASAGERARFEREVEILAQLHHPNIVAVLDSGVVDGSFYYVMDYISGRTLDEHVRQAGLDMRGLIELMAKVCEAIHAAHLRGVIHRDIKPSNVRVDASGEPHIVDFGLAKIAGGSRSGGGAPEAMTLTGQFIGSLPWASPEQAEGRPDTIDLRTDVYSLGVVMYQMLTGVFPYEVAGNMRDVLDNILRAEPRRPSTVRGRINDEVETIVLKCLSKERERRYQSAGEIARDLRRYLAGEPIEAKRDSGWYVLRKTMKRHRGPVIAGAIVLGSIVVFAIIATGLWLDARQARQDADRALRLESGARAEADAQRDRAVQAELAMRSERDRAVRAEADATTARALAESERDRATSAQAEALAQRDLAEAQVRLAERTREFLFDAILSARPEVDRGRDVRMVDFLRAAADRVDDARIEDAIAKAQLRQVIGQALFALGETTLAQVELSRAVEILSLAAGAGDDRALSAVNDLAIVLRNTGDAGRARDLLERCIEAWSARYAPGDAGYAKILGAMNNQARAQARMGDHEGALAIFARLLPAMDATFGAAHANTLGVRGNLAIELNALDRHAEAFDILRPLLATMLAELPEHHPLIARTRLDLASALMGLERFDEAEVELRSAIADFEHIHREQPAHQSLSGARFRLARLLIERDRPDEAEAILRRLVDLTRDDERTSAFDRGAFEAALGWAIVRSGRADEGEAFLLAGFALMRGASGLRDPDVRTVAARIVAMYEQMGREDRAAEFRALIADGG